MTIRIIINSHTTLPATLDDISIDNVFFFFPCPPTLVMVPIDINPSGRARSTILPPFRRLMPASHGGFLWDLWETEHVPGLDPAKVRCAHPSCHDPPSWTDAGLAIMLRLDRCMSTASGTCYIFLGRGPIFSLPLGNCPSWFSTSSTSTAQRSSRS